MAWTHINSEGTSSKSSNTTLALNPGTNPAADSIVFAVYSTDNPDNVGPLETTHHSMADDQGNTWAKIVEFQGNGNANTTVTTSLWISKLDTTITGNITGTLDVALNVRVLLMSEFTVGAGKTFSLPTFGDGRNSGSGTSPLVSSGATDNIEHLYIGVTGVEGPSGDSFTDDSEYTTNVRVGTTGGGSAGNQTASISRNIETSTSDIFGPTITSRDWVALIAVIDEVDLPSTGQPFYIRDSYTLPDFLGNQQS